MTDSGGADSKGRWFTGIVIAIIAGIFVPIVVALITHRGSSGSTSQSASTPPSYSRSGSGSQPVQTTTPSDAPGVPGSPISVEPTRPEYKPAKGFPL